jgi:hypothetical protein
MLVCFFIFAHKAAGACGAPGFPCALHFREGNVVANLGRNPRRGIMNAYLKSEAPLSRLVKAVIKSLMYRKDCPCKRPAKFWLIYGFWLAVIQRRSIQSR